MQDHTIKITLKVSSTMNKEELKAFYKDVLTDFEGAEYKTKSIEVAVENPNGK